MALSINNYEPLYTRLPDRNKNAGPYIILCSEDLEKVDLDALNAQHSAQFGTGFSYHYVVLRNGVCIYARSEMYTSHLPGDLGNNISILIEGNLNVHDAEDIQKDSLVDLLNYLLAKRNLQWTSIKTLSELVGGDSPGKQVNWNDIKDKVKQAELIGNPYKRMSEDVTLSGITQPKGKISQFYSDAKNNNLKAIGTIVGAPTPTLIAMNPHIPDPYKIIPGTPVFYLVTPQSQVSIVAQQQKTIASSLTLKVRNSVDTAIQKKKDAMDQIKVSTVVDINSFKNTTLFGGKQYPEWMRRAMTLPGYEACSMKVTKVSTGEVQIIQFAIGPSSFSDTRQNTQQFNKTNGGFFIMRTGKQPGSVQLTGYMLDTREVQERHQFIERYKQYIEDIKNGDLEYVNDYIVKLLVEGREYSGYMQSISFSKSAVQQFTYQYSMSFVVLSDALTYSNQTALHNADITHDFKEVTNPTTQQKTIVESVYATIK